MNEWCSVKSPQDKKGLKTLTLAILGRYKVTIRRLASTRKSLKLIDATVSSIV